MSDLTDMSCAAFADVAAELALGVLTGRERAEALAHLDHCEACREHVRQLTMTGEELLALLPSREPPAGFETRVMDRLGLSVPAPRRIPASRPRLIPKSRPRQLLAAAAVTVAVVASGVGGWGLRAATTSPAAAWSPLSSAALLSARHENVGEIFYYDGKPSWVYMSVNMDSGTGTVICQLESTDGKITNAGSFRLRNGYGSWASTGTVGRGELAGARLVTADGRILATATLPTDRT